MSNTVEDYFIAPMIEHFESEPTDGVRATILNDMADYAAADLNTAVEWLKRARQSVKTFPSPKECIKAIKAVTGGRKERPVIGGSVITAETYAANAIAFCAGLREIPIIREKTPQWEEWHDYWRWLGVNWLLYIVKDRKLWTVPAEFPELFDPRFNRARPAKKAA